MKKRAWCVSILLCFMVAPSCRPTALPDGSIDQSAADLMRRVEEKMNATRTLVSESVVETTMPDGRVSLRGRYLTRFIRPQRLRIDARETRLTAADTMGAETS